ncbi:hypothetical protein Tco_0455334 [Tanacetum coccineum]
MGDENPIRTLEDYSKPSHEGYRNTIELPERNNVVPLRSDTIRLVQNGCSFHGLRSKDPNQHLTDFLKLVDSLDLDREKAAKLRSGHTDVSTNIKETFVKLIDFPNSKATSGSGMILSSVNIETFFLTTLLLAVHFLACSESDSSDTSTVSSVVSAVFFPCEPLPLLFFEGD